MEMLSLSFGSSCSRRARRLCCSRSRCVVGLFGLFGLPILSATTFARGPLFLRSAEDCCCGTDCPNAARCVGGVPGVEPPVRSRCRAITTSDSDCRCPPGVAPPPRREGEAPPSCVSDPVDDSPGTETADPSAGTDTGTVSVFPTAPGVLDGRRRSRSAEGRMSPGDCVVLLLETGPLRSLIGGAVTSCRRLIRSERAWESVSFTSPLICSHGQRWGFVLGILGGQRLVHTDLSME